MMDDITALQAEVERLRDLLAENGIDPDPEPYVPPPAKFGPPTEFEYKMRQVMDKLVAKVVADLLKPNPFLENQSFAGIGGQIGTSLRIRLPNDCTVIP